MAMASSPFVGRRRLSGPRFLEEARRASAARSTSSWPFCAAPSARAAYASSVQSIELTFDDGPDPVWTPRVLEALADLGLRASFFVLAPAAVARPDLVAAMQRAGHAVELHSYGHVRPTRQSHAEVESDTRAALAALARVGVRPRRWRPPWGIATPAVHAVALAHSLTLTGWTLDTNDWRGDAAPTMLAAARDELRPGAIVLLHDGLGPGARRTGCAEPVALVPLLAAELAVRSLSVEVPRQGTVRAPSGPLPRGGSRPVAEAAVL